MKKILDFRNRSYSDVSGKYQNMKKKHLNIREARIMDVYEEQWSLPHPQISEGFMKTLRTSAFSKVKMEI